MFHPPITQLNTMTIKLTELISARGTSSGFVISALDGHSAGLMSNTNKRSVVPASQRSYSLLVSYSAALSAHPEFFFCVVAVKKDGRV